VRILVDMSVDIRVTDWLRSQDHDAVHLRDDGLHRMPNGEIFANCFPKKSKRGAKTLKPDVDLITSRLRVAEADFWAREESN
jgi:predicted nuclease of predicted toxin-antitoxin system